MSLRCSVNFQMWYWVLTLTIRVRHVISSMWVEMV